MQKNNILIFLIIIFVSFFISELSLAQSGDKHSTKRAQIQPTFEGKDQPIAKRTRLQLQLGFENACKKAGMIFKSFEKQLIEAATTCGNPETDSIASDLGYDDPGEVTLNESDNNCITLDSGYDSSGEATSNEPDNDFRPALDSTPQINSRDIIKTANQKACYLHTQGEPTLAAEILEQAIVDLQSQNTPMDKKKLPEFFELFQFWASIPSSVKNKPQTQDKIKHWFDSWPASKWLNQAPEVLVEILANVFEFEGFNNPDLPYYDEIMLDDLLSSIDSIEARNSIKLLIQASATEDISQKEQHLSNAILAGYSHPLPYLQMISHLVSQNRYEKAHHIFEMYRLAVIFNSEWSNAQRKTYGVKYAREVELDRLEGIHKKALQQMYENSHTLSNRYLPTLERLDESLKHWPEDSRQQAEDMLFDKTFETDWNMHEPIIKFTNAVLVRARQRWLESGKQEQKIAKVQDYIRSAYARRCLPRLHEGLALMLTDQGREQEAADVLYDFVSGYREGVGTDYDLSLYLIAVAHELNQAGESVSVPSYDQALKLVEDIRISAQDKALGERLQKIRAKARIDGTDTQDLRKLYESIPEELTQFNSGGSMSGAFEPMLIRGLTEAKEQKLYSGPIPDLEFISKLYSELRRKNMRMLQLFSPTFRHSDIEEMTGLYLEALSILDNSSDIPEEAMALQLLAHSKWLAYHDPSITPLNTLPEARNLVKKASKHIVTKAIKEIRDFKWPERRPEVASMVAEHYRSIVHSAKKSDAPAPARKKRTKRKYQRAPSYSVPPGYTLYNVPSDGFCMFHALSAMYNISMQSLLTGMYNNLHETHRMITNNLSEGLPWDNGLSLSAHMMIHPLIQTVLSNGKYDLVELQHSIQVLQEAIFYHAHGQSAPGRVWGTETLLNTAAFTIYELMPDTPTPFVAQLPTLNASGNGYTGPTQFIQYNPDGSNSDQPPLNGLPLLIHTGEDHWMYALPATPTASEPVTGSDQMNDFMSGLSLDHGNPANLPYLFQNLHLPPNFNFEPQLNPDEGVLRFQVSGN